MMRKLVVAVVAVAVFLITPYLVFEEITSFKFGEAEMRAAVEGTWHLQLTPRQGPPRSIALKIEQAQRVTQSTREHGLIRSAAACGHRTFIRSAEACMDASDMGLKLTAIGKDRPASLNGRFFVAGKRFERGYLELEIDGESISAHVSPTGEVLSVGFANGSATLTRFRPLTPDGC